MPISIDEFVCSLTETGILPPAEVTSLLSSLPEDRAGVDVERIARKLVKEQKLTRFQATAIFRRQARGLRFGDYIVLDKIGSGGIGQVFKAENRQTGQTVALKLLRATFSKSHKAVARFYREAETAARLRHPNLVSIREAGEWNGLHFLVMELIDGRDVRSVVKERGPLSPAVAIDIVIQAARGLECAHAHGIIHRDIKPANLLLDMTGRVIVLDLGLARLEEPEEEGEDGQGGRLTMPGTFLGTCDYVAPEQAVDAHDVDGRCDIYSLGCTLYYLLRGRAPYRRENAPLTLLAHCQDPIPNLQEEFPEVPRRLAALFTRMLAKQPAGRVRTMTEVVDELETAQRELAADSADLGKIAGKPQAGSGGAATQAARRVDSAEAGIPRPGGERSAASSTLSLPSAPPDARSVETATSLGITATEPDPAGGGRGPSRWLALARAPFTAAWAVARRATKWIRPR